MLCIYLHETQLMFSTEHTVSWSLKFTGQNNQELTNLYFFLQKCSFVAAYSTIFFSFHDLNSRNPSRIKNRNLEWKRFIPSRGLWACIVHVLSLCKYFLDKTSIRYPNGTAQCLVHSQSVNWKGKPGIG